MASLVCHNALVNLLVPYRDVINRKGILLGGGLDDLQYFLALASHCTVSELLPISGRYNLLLQIPKFIVLQQKATPARKLLRSMTAGTSYQTVSTNSLPVLRLPQGQCCTTKLNRV